MPCENCKANRYCAQMRDLHRRWFFAWYANEKPSCSDYEPRWWRGITEVAA